MFEAQYLGKHATNGTHTAIIGDSLYTFKFNSKRQAISFKTGGKMVARTYKTFKEHLNISSGSVAASTLIAATQNAPIHNREYFAKHGY
jgi:hypothetical protein